MRRVVIGCVAAALFSGPVQGQKQREGAREAVDFAVMAEDIEIMQQIIGKTLRQDFAGDGAQAALLNAFGMPWATTKYKKGDKLSSLTFYLAAQDYQSLSSFDRFNVEGFYVPGTGAVFTLDLPAATKEVELKDQEDKPDLWDEIEGKVRGSKTEATYFPPGKKPKTRTTIDHEALDEAIDLLVKTVGEYGSRIEQLTVGESIILAARTSARRPWYTPEKLLEATYSRLYISAQGIRPHRVIIKVPVRAIRDFEKGELDLHMLKESSEITKYGAHGSARQAE